MGGPQRTRQEDDSDEEHLEAQVVQVVLPDKDVEVRLASLDFEAGLLNLHQVRLDGGEVVMGARASIKLASIGHAKTGGDGGRAVLLLAGGKTGPVLLELHFGTVELAANWARHLQAATASSEADEAEEAEGDADLAGAEAAAVQTLHALIEQQEEQVRLLEEINHRKGDQLLQMQKRLEEALNMLQFQQTTYAKQQEVVDKQRPIIGELQDRLEAAFAADRECSMNAAAAASGAMAAARAGATGPVVSGSLFDPPQRSAAAAARPPTAEVQQRRVSVPASTDASTSAEEEESEAGEEEEEEEQPGRRPEDDDDDDDIDGLTQDQMEEKLALLEKLTALMEEKGAIEAQLKNEQEQIAAHLSQMMSLREAFGDEVTG